MRWKPPIEIRRKALLLAGNVKSLREKREWTQEQLAEAIGSTPEYVSMLESGARVPSFKVQEALARAFKVKMAKLMEGM